MNLLFLDCEIASCIPGDDQEEDNRLRKMYQFCAGWHDFAGMGLACVLGLLVLAYGRPRRMTITDDGRMVDTVTGLSVATIDLRDGRPATVTLTDGTEIEVHPGSVVPAGTPRREAAAVGPDVSAA